MNQRRETFISAYLLSGNATQAAIKAGYSVKTAKSIGQRLLTYVDVQKAITNFREKMEEKTAITAESVLQRINALADNAIKESDRLTALEMLAKNLGLYAPKRVDIKVNDYSNLSNEELVQLRQLQAKIEAEGKAHD